MPLTPSTSSPRQRAAPSTTGEREAPTPSQLDILAEREERFATPSLLRRATPVVAMGAVALLLGALLWLFAQSAEPPANASADSTGTASKAPAVAPDAAASPAGVAPQAVSDITAAEARPAAVAAPAAASSAEPTQAQAQASPPAPAATMAERARKAQMRREADARAKAQRAPTQRQPRELDKAGTTAPAEARGGAGPAAPSAETASRPRAEAAVAGVREFCAARGNVVSQLFCHSRECRKPERAKDATCVRLKEIEESQRRVEPQ